MKIGDVFQVLQLIVPAIQTAENFIRGAGRGSEKKEAVLGEFLRRVNDLRREIGEVAGINPSQFNWVKMALSAPQFLQKVGVLVDAIVDLANFIETFEEEPQAPEVIN